MTRARSGSAAKRGCKASKATRATYMKPKFVDKRLKPVEQKSLDTLRMLRDVLKVQNPCRRHLAYFSGYESHKQQGFEVVLRNNKKKGLVHFPDTETVQLTDAGYRVAGEMSDPPTSDEEFHQFLMAHITPAQGKVFTIISDGRLYTQEDVVKLSKNPRYANQGAKTQGFQVIVRSLKAMGFAECPDNQLEPLKALIRLTDFCFPFEGRPNPATVADVEADPSATAAKEET